MKKIAFLFLTRKELNHPRIWEKLLENSLDKFNVYIHSKESLEDPFFKKFEIKNRVPTQYLYHGKAWQALLQEALKDESNQKFIYLSESCSPLYLLEDIYHYLIIDSNSYMRYSKPWWPRDSEREMIEIPLDHRWGNAEWIILNRDHARMIAEDCEILDIASQHMNSDHEGYPSSLFSLKGCLDQVIYRMTTYAEFSAPSGPPFPYHFRSDSEIERRYLLNAKRGGSLFARKFTPEFPSKSLIEIAEERLMALPAEVAGNSVSRTPEMERKIIRLQAQEEMSQANTCALLSMLLNQGFIEVGYEIGAGLGLHMERVLQNVFIMHYKGVDDYRRKSYQGIQFTEAEEDRLYAYVQKRIDSLGLEAELIRASSLEVAKTVSDQTVDFIYFNTQHSLISMDEQLQAWLPKLKKGGILAGYQNTAFYPHLEIEVKQFFSAKHLQVHQECVEPKLWWVQI